MPGSVVWCRLAQEATRPMMHRHVSRFALPLLFAGCAAAGTAPVPTRRPRDASVTIAPPPAPAASSASSAAPAEAAEAKAFSIPATPPGADPQKVLMASSICAATYLPSGAIGCRAPPPFDRPKRGPDGRLVLHEGDPLEFCALYSIYHGSFTKPGAKQAVLSFGQCKDPDDDTWDSGFPGDAVLVEEINGRWHVVANELDVNADECHKARRADGRDILLCQSNFGAFGIGSIEYFFVLDFNEKEKHAHSFAWLPSTAGMTGCMKVEAGEPPAPSGLVGLRVTGAKLAQRNGDGTPDLVVDVERARARPSPALDARLRDLCRQGADDQKALPAPSKARLEFVSAGQRFAPTAKTRKLLEAWEKDTPDVLQLKGAAPPAFDE